MSVFGRALEELLVLWFLAPEQLVISHNAVDDRSSNFLHIVTREHKDLGCMQVSPMLFPQNLGQTLGRRDEIRLPPGMIGVRIIEFYVQFLRKNFGIFRSGMNVGFIEIEPFNSNSSQRRIKRQ